MMAKTKNLAHNLSHFCAAGIFAVCCFTCIVKSQILFLSDPRLGKVNSKIVQCDPGTSFGT